MGVEELARVGPVAVSVLALVLSLLNIYLQRKDRSPRLGVRARYEYRAGPSGGGSPALRVHDGSQEGLYMRLGDFLREHGLDYPQGSPVVRFTVSNEGEKVAYLDAVRLVLRGGGPFGRLMVLDPVEGRVVMRDLARDVANVAGSGAEDLPVEIVPGNSVGYKFSLTSLANTLEKEGITGNVRLALEVTDRLGNTYRRPFRVNTDLWAYPEDPT
jgi:hypothetical protein